MSLTWYQRLPKSAKARNAILTGRYSEGFPEYFQDGIGFDSIKWNDVTDNELALTSTWQNVSSSPTTIERGNVLFPRNCRFGNDIYNLLFAYRLAVSSKLVDTQGLVRVLVLLDRQPNGGILVTNPQDVFVDKDALYSPILVKRQDRYVILSDRVISLTSIAQSNDPDASNSPQTIAFHEEMIPLDFNSTFSTGDTTGLACTVNRIQVWYCSNTPASSFNMAFNQRLIFVDQS